MTTLSALIVITIAFLAYSNGANDNFKGVATLYGSGTTGYRTALAWATITTFAGSLLALQFAGGLVEVFRGKGLVPEALTHEPSFLLAVSLGAALTVLLATRFGLPVSTTHALTGGLVGAGLLAASGDVRLAALGRQFVLPLLFAPVASLLLSAIAYVVLLRGSRVFGVARSSCVCVGEVVEEVIPHVDGTLRLVRTGEVVIGQVEDCRSSYSGRVLGVEAGQVLDGLHFLTAGAVGFARGLNDTPKMIALVVASEVIAPTAGLVMVSVAIAVGGLVNARRVAETMSQKITRMSPGQGFAANLVTALMVTLASRLGLPVSTTHVSVGSLFGIGLVTRTARRDIAGRAHYEPLKSQGIAVFQG
jgi:PiT family inorganic phosphate transporter